MATKDDKKAKKTAAAKKAAPKKTAAKAPKYSKEWIETVGAFANEVEHPIEKISELLAGVVGKPGAKALKVLANEAASPAEEIAEALGELGIPTGILKMSLPILRGVSEEDETPEVDEKEKVSGETLSSLLPKLPDTKSLLAKLQTGGVLNVEEADYLSVAKIALGEKVGLLDVAETVHGMLISHARSMREPCGEMFSKIDEILAASKQAELLGKFGVTTGNISKELRKDFSRRLTEKFWPALATFHSKSLKWEDGWLKKSHKSIMLNPMGMAGGLSGLPKRMNKAPDTTPLLDAAEDVVEMVNFLFADVNIWVSRKMGEEMIRISEILDDRTLPALVGKSNKKELLDTLGVGVTSSLRRMENNLALYIMAVCNLENVNSADLPDYLSDMVEIGENLQLEKFLPSVGIPSIHQL